MLATIQRLDKLAAALADFLAHGMLDDSALDGHDGTQGASLVNCD